MKLKISKEIPEIFGNITITGSKSESNRLLILQALFENLSIENISNSDDSHVMQQALASTDKIVDVHHAGTAMRFLTAYFSVYDGRETLLTGSTRMQERPIGILVDALRSLGADIEYQKNEGYAPILIKGKKLEMNAVKLAANVSSQYISALMMIGATLPNGLKIELEGKITSVPYIEMTRALHTQIGVKSSFEGQIIEVFKQDLVEKQTLTVESDWSSASYFYGLVALSRKAKISLSSYKQNSLQGDASLVKFYEDLGVKTSFKDAKITLEKVENSSIKAINFDLSNSPDIAQTIAVTCYGLGIGCDLTGLHTLKIKETDRLEALHAELSKLGATLTVTDNSLHLEPATVYNENITIKTYQDHRMAMAFAPLALKVPILFEDAEVVNKSYPDFWKDFEHLGFKIEVL
ncbi:MAG: 3-phosphoshikimate 1-carboxyvinyltransferase [Leeuwenhoekiella sp.]